MVGPKTGKSVEKPVKVSAAKAVDTKVAAAKATPAKAVTKPIETPPVAKAAAPATPPKAIASAAVKPTPAKVAPAPAKAAPAPVPAKPAEVVAKAAEPVKPPVKPVIAKVVEPAKPVVAKVAEITASLTEKAAAVPVAVVEAIVPPPAAQTVQKGIATMAETITPKSFVPTPESFQSILGDMSTRAKAVMENGAKMAEEMGEFAKGNVEAFMTSSRVAAKGAETLGQEAAAYSKKSLESATTAFKGFASAKSPSELFKLQSDYARSSFDAAVAESSKFSEAVMKLFGEITQPISNRVALAAEKIKTPAF